MFFITISESDFFDLLFFMVFIGGIWKKRNRKIFEAPWFMCKQNSYTMHVQGLESAYITEKWLAWLSKCVNHFLVLMQVLPNTCTRIVHEFCAHRNQAIFEDSAKTFLKIIKAIIFEVALWAIAYLDFKGFSIRDICWDFLKHFIKENPIMSCFMSECIFDPIWDPDPTRGE